MKHTLKWLLVSPIFILFLMGLGWAAIAALVLDLDDGDLDFEELDDDEIMIPNKERKNV